MYVRGILRSHLRPMSGKPITNSLQCHYTGIYDYLGRVTAVHVQTTSLPVHINPSQGMTDHGA